jgi:hypothetical protein
MIPKVNILKNMQRYHHSGTRSGISMVAFGLLFYPVTLRIARYQTSMDVWLLVKRAP